MEPLEDDPSARRSSIRFSSAAHRRVYDPEQQVAADDSHSEARNENVFRAPFLPPPCLKKKREPKTPLKDKNQGNVQMSISPGTTATEDKKAAMLRKLEKRRSSNQAKWAKEKEAVQVLDMPATERSFLEQAEVPEPRFSDISMITPGDTFIMTTPRRSQGPVCSTPFREPPPQKQLIRRRSSFQAPAASTSLAPTMLTQSEIYESAEDIADRQFNALSVWCNMLLNTCNRFDDGTVDLGRTKQDASKKLQELLSKQTKATPAEQPQKFTYTEFLQRQEFETLRTRAMKVYKAKEVPQKIVSMLQNDALAIRDGFNVYSDISLKTTLLAIFLSFHPVWLHLGMETVFGRAIDVPNGGSFLSTMTSFINTRVFSDPEIMRKKKFAVGTVKMIVTPIGREALHRHFLTKMCQFLYCLEECKAAGVISSDPRLFVRKSIFKSLNDVFSELSREVLSASGSSMAKVFAKIGFTPSFKQGYFDDLEYRIKAITDLYDGVMFGKLLEVVCGLGRGTVMCKLRNPGGDRLRKLTNVTNVIEQAVKAGIDCGNVKPESIVGGNKEAILELMWRLVGVFVLASDSNSEELRRESLRLQLTTDLQSTSGEKQNPEDFLLRMCQQLGLELGIQVNSLDDLRDGRFLAALWKAYNPHANAVLSYPGSNLFKKVVAAAETELGLPVGLHGSLPLFIHMFLTRIFNIRRLNEAATRIQKAYRSHLFFRRLKAHLSSEEWAREKEERQRRLNMLDRTYVVSSSAEEGVSTAKEETFTANDSRNGDRSIEESIRSYHLERTFHDYEDREAGRLAFEKIMEEARTKAAVSIQTAVRGYLARRLFKRLCGERDEYVRKVVIVQNIVRGFLARRQLKRLQAQLHEHRNKSATVIQNTYRGFSQRKKFQQMKDQRRQFVHAVTLAQNSVRGFLARRRLAHLKEEKRKDEEERKRQLEEEERLHAEEERRQREEEERRLAEERQGEEEERLRRLEEERLRAEEEERQMQLEKERRLAEERKRQEEERQRRFLAAVVKVQALVRSYLARKKFHQVKEEKRQREEEQERQRLLEEERRRAEEERRQREEEERRQREERKRQEEERRRAELERQREEEVRRLAEERQRQEEEERQRQLEEEKRRVEVELERKKREEVERLRLEEAAAIRIQSLFRGHLARERVAAIKEDRQRYVKNVVRVQSQVRGFLARCRIRCQLDESIRNLAAEAPEEEEQQQAPIPPSPSRAATSAEILAMKDQSAAKREAKLRSSSATTIQKTWRGFCVRKRLEKEIQSRRVAMCQYKEDAAAQEEVDDHNGRHMPAFKRLEMMEGQLFDVSLYRVKVAATIIGRLATLSPMLARHFVLHCGGINAVLDRLEQCDRSPPMQEIVSLTLKVFLRLTQLARSDLEVAATIASAAEDCQKVVLHQFHAFYQDEVIVVDCCDVLIDVRRVASDVVTAKAAFYLNQGERRFARLPNSDAKKRALKRLQAAFL